MANFDQSNQTVQGNQYNAETIHFDQANSLSDYVERLKTLEIELRRAAQSKAINANAAQEAEHHLTAALTVATADEPDKKTIVDHLQQPESYPGS